MIENPDPSDKPFCIFNCGDPLDESVLSVEMNVDAKGEFHASQDHLNQAQRVSGIAHRRCYEEWYERTYHSPFTITETNGT